ncbi:hypothetical protein [Mesorhizobium sp. B2-3-2]|uniref:hypothetical protein n=1 Tax=Mesorhizobium sp. B2-3-2 TaxID=2589961 RepID=UPI001128A474|nr:hypothetical protein [Mesorhizobium sp. B2-3-2]TPM37040.1 hypothetical protein FJ964_30360 [Mesorhizobium sp. B2-3-2]
MADSIKQPGQAGTENEIEITPEMVDGGELALLELIDPPLPPRLAREVAVRVYVAMRLRSPRGA